MIVSYDQIKFFQLNNIVKCNNYLFWFDILFYEYAYILYMYKHRKLKQMKN